MKVEELRIGNLVKWGVHECVVKGIHTDTVDGTNPYIYGSVMIGAMPLTTIEGIPLTPEWLERAGFKQGSAMQKSLDWFNLIRILDRSEYVDKTYRWNGRENHVILKYVHQLQNLYFALTGQELTLKP